MNEMEANVAPTDTRHRPDMRLHEEGRLDEAHKIMVQLEEKDAKKAKREPYWFKLVTDPYTNESVYRSTGEYWACKARQDWSRCPTLFAAE